MTHRNSGRKSQVSVSNPPNAIIVFGALRSGTTMLRLMIDAHPAMACSGEHDVLFEHLTSGDPATATYDWDAMEADFFYRSLGLSKPPHSNGADTMADFLIQMGGETGKTPVLMVHRHLDRVRAFLPHAPIVHMLRDPRDVARSSLKLNFAGHVMFGADHWIATESEWQVSGPADAMTLQYEALVADPVQHLRRFCEHVGLPFDPAMLSYDRDTTYENPDATLIDQWRRKLSDRQIQLIEARLGALLTAAGYAPSGVPPAQLTPTLAIWLNLVNRARIWRNLVARYGFRDPVVRGIGRRIGMTGLARSAQHRMDQVTLHYLQ